MIYFLAFYLGGSFTFALHYIIHRKCAEQPSMYIKVMVCIYWLPTQLELIYDSFIMNEPRSKEQSK